jgi:hypothetical protein
VVREDILPSWFVVGAKVWFMGFGPETEVISINIREHIDIDEKFWVGRDLDGEHIYPLNEVPEYWLPNHIDFRTLEK